MFGFFVDSPEYELRKITPFVAPTLYATIPKDLFRKSTVTGIYYVLRDLVCAYAFYKAAICIDPCMASVSTSQALHPVTSSVFRWTLWGMYWWWQGIAFAGWWCLGHEAGHGNISPHRAVNHVVGFVLQTCLMSPYYNWRSTHHAHHKATSSLERDENYVPLTRSDHGLPALEYARSIDYDEIFEDAPLYTLLRMLVMQVFGWHIYLLTNAMGSPSYPKGTNHFSPSSPLFKPGERRKIIVSNVGLITMACILMVYASRVGVAQFVKIYLVPYLLCNHWIVMLTYLHHNCPTIPHYRKNEWTFLRGAFATVDRPFLGVLGRFFLHNVSHDHIAHHLFSQIPFYNQPQVTEHLKKTMGTHYNYDSTNSFRALYRAFTECCFVEDEGDILFYKNRRGGAQRELAVVKK